MQAEECFGPGVKVYSEGRSGGWAIVDGLPPFDSWDAVMVAKWTRFAKWAGEVVDDIPYITMSTVCLNVYEQRADEWAAEVAVDATYAV